MEGIAEIGEGSLQTLLIPSGLFSTRLGESPYTVWSLGIKVPVTLELVILPLHAIGPNNLLSPFIELQISRHKLICQHDTHLFNHIAGSSLSTHPQ